MSSPSIHILNPTEHDLIEQIAMWGQDEWGTPVDDTIQRLSNPVKDELLVQLILKIDGKFIGTGRLCGQANITNVHPSLQQYGPWISGLFVHHDFRNQGLGKLLLQSLENSAVDQGFKEAYLYTFTAEAFYKSMDWSEIVRVFYKDHETVVLKKGLVAH